MNEIDKAKMDAFWSARTTIADPRIATNYRDDGRLGFDLELARRFCRPGARVLDLGAGTCTLSAPLLDEVDRVVAVDKFVGFLEMAPEHPRLETVAADVAGFTMDATFDLILLFGVANFLTVAEETDLYRECATMLAPNGVFVAKNQCGVDKEVVVDRYSEELGAHYHARYPARDEQLQRLEEFFAVDVIDIYPPEINRWADTHFYAFVCTAK